MIVITGEVICSDVFGNIFNLRLNGSHELRAHGIVRRFALVIEVQNLNAVSVKSCELLLAKRINSQLVFCRTLGLRILRGLEIYDCSLACFE